MNDHQVPRAATMRIQYSFETLLSTEQSYLLKQGLTPQQVIGIDIGIRERAFDKETILRATTGQLQDEIAAFNNFYSRKFGPVPGGIVRQRNETTDEEKLSNRKRWREEKKREEARQLREFEKAKEEKKLKSKRAKAHLEELVKIENPLA
jgi:hypothetical protein